VALDEIFGCHLRRAGQNPRLGAREVECRCGPRLRRCCHDGHEGLREAVTSD
jgi:hypothetical protein